MANFPTSPSTGDQFSTSKVTYRWNGSAWDILEGVKQGTIQDDSSAVGSLEFAEGAEPATTANASTIYATTGGMYVKNSSGSITALTADAALGSALTTVTSEPATIASTGQMVHWDRSGEVGQTSGLYYVAPDGTKTLIQGDS
jgi:hypothetical protein